MLDTYDTSSIEKLQDETLKEQVISQLHSRLQQTFYRQLQLGTEPTEENFVAAILGKPEDEEDKLYVYLKDVRFEWPHWWGKIGHNTIWQVLGYKISAWTLGQVDSA
jgi:hypothetical protein